MSIYPSVSELIGSTPLVALQRFSAERGLTTPLVAKVEFFNPNGSVKDRVGLSMINSAEKAGLLKAGGTIIEPTSGNTGIGISAVAASRGYKVIIVMTDKMSIERRLLMTALGAQLVLTPGSLGMKGCIAKAKELRDEIPGSIILGQFTNPANPQAHFDTTGPEIWKDTGGNVDIFVAGVGSGGTITGVGRYLKSQNPNVKIVAVQPAKSPVLTGGEPTPHAIQGIGAGFVPDNYDPSVVDEVVDVEDQDAFEASRQLGRTEGLLVGVSSGAALAAAAQVAARPENAGKRVVVLLPDTGERYLSTDLFKTE